MSPTTHAARLPWEDRWRQPSLEQLLHPLDASTRKLFEQMLEGLDALADARAEVVWFGAGWNWTIVYRHGDSDLCYLIPKPIEPVICIAMSDAQIDALPIRRLARPVREAIKIARFAIEKHYAYWSPTASADIEGLLDLTNRLYKQTTAQGGAVDADADLADGDVGAEEEVEPASQDKRVKVEKKPRSKTPSKVAKGKRQGTGSGRGKTDAKG